MNFFFFWVKRDFCLLLLSFLRTHNFKINFHLTLSSKICSISWIFCANLFYNWFSELDNSDLGDIWKKKVRNTFFRGQDVIWCILCWWAICFLLISKKIKIWHAIWKWLIYFYHINNRFVFDFAAHQLKAFIHVLKS